jgi:hypothetical protein
MQQYKVIGPFVTMIAGIVTISGEQARARQHALIPIAVDDDGAGVYEVNGPITFKRHEEFTHDGAIPKGMAINLDEIDEGAEGKPKRKRRTKAEIAAANAAPADASEEPEGETDADGEPADEEGASE